MLSSGVYCTYIKPTYITGCIYIIYDICMHESWRLNFHMDPTTVQSYLSILHPKVQGFCWQPKLSILWSCQNVKRTSPLHRESVTSCCALRSVATRTSKALLVFDSDHFRHQQFPEVCKRELNSSRRGDGWRKQHSSKVQQKRNPTEAQIAWVANDRYDGAWPNPTTVSPFLCRSVKPVSD
jgi:hypothetical protein